MGMLSRGLRNLVLSGSGLLIISLSFAASAGLVSGRGGEVGRDSFNETVGLYDLSDPNTVFNPIGYESGAALSGYSFNSFHDLVYATPMDLCHFNTYYPPNSNELVRTHCEYVFEQGETIELFGDIEALMAGAEQYVVTWTISNGLGKRWDYSFNYANANDVSTDLQVAMPSGMGAGRYTVEFQFQQQAKSNQQFFEYSQYTDPYVCAVLGPVGTPETCGQTGSDYTLWSRSNTAQLTIAAPEPGSFMLLLFGALALLRRRNGI